MKMREEIDALRVMGLDPMEVLIVPRIMALVIGLPLLTFIASIAALLGGGGGTTQRPWPVLRPGATGFRVTCAQRLLRQAGHEAPTGGVFDDPTTAAVKAFQSSRSLDPDGVVGRLTWEAPLALTRRNGDRGEGVRAVQTALTARGASVTVDGIFGSGTQAAVERFQDAKGLTVDGVVGLDTWSRLLA